LLEDRQYGLAILEQESCDIHQGLDFGWTIFRHLRDDCPPHAVPDQDDGLPLRIDDFANTIHIRLQGDGRERGFIASMTW
jgi:hypothetical protein